MIYHLLSLQQQQKETLIAMSDSFIINWHEYFISICYTLAVEKNYYGSYVATMCVTHWGLFTDDQNSYDKIYQ